MQPLQRVRYPGQAIGVDIQRGQLQPGLPLQQMRGLAARRSAGIEYPHPRSQLRKQLGHPLRSLILDAHPALRESWQLLHGDRLLQLQSVRSAGAEASLDSGCAQ